MLFQIAKNKQKIQKKGGEKEMRKIPMKVAIILSLTLVFTSFCGHQEAMATFDVSEIWKAVTNVITSTYDGLGRLINKSHVIDSNGVNVDGESFVSKETIEYDEQNPEQIKRRTVETTSTPLESVLLDKLGITKEQLDAIMDGKIAHSDTKQVIDYTYDANGALTGATGTEYIDGQESPWWEYKDAAGHLLTKRADGTYYYVDPNTNTEVDVPEGSVTKTLKVGSSYTGTLKLEFALINGEAKVSKRSGDIVYRDSAGKETFTRHMDTFNHYDEVVTSPTYGLVLFSETWQKDTYTETYKYTSNVDADGDGELDLVDTGVKLFRAQYIKTTYKYNADGSLKKVSGTGSGWGLMLTSDGYMVYTSNITVEYAIISGITRQTKFEEKAYYVPAENSPPDQPPVDPVGRIIGMFNIRSNSNNVGEYNEYTYLVVQTSDGKVYLLRTLIDAGAGNPDQKTWDLSGYNIGDKIQFEGAFISTQGGNQDANRIWRLTEINKQ